MIFPSAAATRMRGPSCIDLPTTDQDYAHTGAPQYIGSCAVRGNVSLRQVDELVVIPGRCEPIRAYWSIALVMGGIL